MATPSSSATTPSPRPPYLQPSPAPPPASIVPRDPTANMKEERQKAIQRFFANAELSQLARGLRTRLSYASFKATHNLTHNTLPDLEAQAQSHASSSRQAASRPSGNLTSQGSTGLAPTSSPRSTTRRGTMPPPPQVTASATQSLFSSLLQPPPSKRARTIHNPQDPPVPPPTRPPPATPPRKPTAKATRASNSSAAASKSKSRKDPKGKRRESGHAAGSSSRIITPQSTLGSEGFADNDDDMKAAATLTSLLLSRPSMSGSASSPRSSHSAGSDGGSSHSFSHYAQSSTRTTAPSSIPQSALNSFTAYARSRTPPAEVRHARTQSLPHIGSYQANGNTTPKAQMRPATSRLANSSTPHPPSDTEAADLMLFLATSPSPVRASSSRDKDAKDMAAFRTLSGSSALKGRVLFPSSGPVMDERAPSGSKPLRREATGSFSSVLTVATELIDDPADVGSQDNVTMSSSPFHANGKRARDGSAHPNIPAPPTVIPPTPTDEAPARFISLDASPSARPRAVSEHLPLERSVSAPTPLDSKTGPPVSPTPGNNVPFNYTDFINVSPSPAGAGSSTKLTSLRANVGRKLFEEHQGLASSAAGSRESLSGHGTPAGLGAGIDLLRSQV